MVVYESPTEIFITTIDKESQLVDTYFRNSFGNSKRDIKDFRRYVVNTIVEIYQDPMRTEWFKS